MSQAPLPFKIDSLDLSDIPMAIAVERAAYRTAPPQRDYHNELRRNSLAHYFGLRTSLPQPNPGAHESSSPYHLIGVGGFWLLADEIHIITLAISTPWKGRGLGEWLLLEMLEKGRLLGAKTATLEVRPSNQVAIRLYQKYQFQQVGARPNYYRDSGEDALILTTPDLNLPDYQVMLTQHKASLWPRLAQISIEN